MGKEWIRKFWQRYGSRPRFRKFNELMFDCSIHGLGILNHEGLGLSGEDYFIEKLLPLYVGNQEGDFVDVGAHKGNYTKDLLAAFPQARIVACEPNPKTFLKLQAAVVHDKAVLLNQGLGATDGLAQIYDREDRDGSSGHGSLYREVIEDLHAAESVSHEVLISTMDAVLEQYAVEHVHLVKIDTEGHELEVLKGAAKTIASGKVDIFQIEFNEMNVVSKVFFRDLAGLLKSYRPYRLLPKGVIRIRQPWIRAEIFGFQNLVFVHERFDPDSCMNPRASSL
ncbi:MAG: FkbM family methyltransferase [Opitutaceae bacterium]